ncbi:MAG: rod shape-determining protein MreC [Terriglobales bacterium]
MDLFKRHLNLTVLVAALFVQVVALAYQVKRPTEQGPTRLIRLWTISAITPVEKRFVHTQQWAHRTWRSYFYLRDVRQENQRLRDENARLRLEQVRMAEDAGQAQRLQALLKFKEQYIEQTVAAQVIGSSGSEQSRVVYIDKGASDGLRNDMAVITPTGVVGKVIRVLPSTAQVLEISDQTSGVGAILEKSRLQGILKGTPAGETMLHYIMSDQKVEPGEIVVTSGGDRIFPKGLPIGRVVQVNPGSDVFLNIRVKPSARLDRLEEVLVITKVVDKEPANIAEAPMRASDILALRLPTVQPKPPDAGKPGGAPPGATPASTSKPAPTTAAAKPGNASAPAMPAGATTSPARVPSAPANAKPAETKKPAVTSPSQAPNAATPLKKPAPFAKPLPNAAQAQPAQPGVKVTTDMNQKPTPKPKPAPANPAAQNRKPAAQPQGAAPATSPE